MLLLMLIFECTCILKLIISSFNAEVSSDNIIAVGKSDHSYVCAENEVPQNIEIEHNIIHEVARYFMLLREIVLAIVTIIFADSYEFVYIEVVQVRHRRL